MPVFGNKKPKAPQSQNIPMWLQYANAGGAGISAAQANAMGGSGNGQNETIYGEKSQKKQRGRTAASGGTTYVESPLEPKPLTVGGNRESKKILRGAGQNTPALVYGEQAQTYVANPQTYTAPSYNTPAWMGPATSPFTPNAGLTLQSQAPGVPGLPLQDKNKKPYRIQNADGTWAYLQSDGSYLTAWGTAGGGDDVPRNSYVNMPPLQQLQPPPAAPTTGYNGYGFGSRYRGWGGGGGGRGGGGGGYNYTPQIPAWYMGLNSWNYSE